jgi:hypothetical protein
VPLTGATKDFQMDAVPLIVPPGLHCHPGYVNVRVEILQQSGEKEFNGLPIHVLRPVREGLTVRGDLPGAAVTLRGPQLTLDGLDRMAVRPFVDLTTVTSAGRYRLSTQVWIDGSPEQVTAEYVFPEKVEVEVVAAPQVATPPEPSPPAPEAQPQ